MNDWGYAVSCLSALLFFYWVTTACLQRHTHDVDDEASLIPFADDPAVARRVEQAIGKTVPATAPPAAFKA